MRKILQPLKGLDPSPIEMDLGNDLIPVTVLGLTDWRADDPDGMKD